MSLLGLIPAAYVGQAAGVGTSLSWTFTALCFTAASRRLGPTRVNLLRILMAVVMLAVTHRVLAGTWVPAASRDQVFYLALSGVVGLSACDQALFTAFVDIGPRLALLVMTTSPLFALGFGAAFLGEGVSGRALAGISLTLAGVAWVVLERRPARDVGSAAHPYLRRGLLLAVAAAALQAAGAMFGKLGIGHGVVEEARHLTPQAATYVRMVFGAAGLLPFVLWRRMRRRGQRRPGIPSRELRIGYALTAVGALLGPYLGVWMSLVAYDRTGIGLAQTLCSLSPVLILPLSAIVERRRPTARAALGALAAVAGSALLFLE